MATETYTPDNIFSKLSEKNETPITVKTGQGELKRGTLLISLAADSGEYIIADIDDTPTAADKLSLVVLAEDIDATSAAVETTGYRSGNFNANYITFGGDDTTAVWKADCRNVNIYLDIAAINSLD